MFDNSMCYLRITLKNPYPKNYIESKDDVFQTAADFTCVPVSSPPFGRWSCPGT